MSSQPVISAPFPFAIGQERPFQTGPWLGGFLWVLLADVAAAGTVTVTHTLRNVPRTVTLLSQSTTYPSRVARNAAATWGRGTCVVKFESAAKAGDAIFLY